MCQYSPPEVLRRLILAKRTISARDKMFWSKKLPRSRGFRIPGILTSPWIFVSSRPFGSFWANFTHFSVRRGLTDPPVDAGTLSIELLMRGRCFPAFCKQKIVVQSRRCVGFRGNIIYLISNLLTFKPLIFYKFPKKYLLPPNWGVGFSAISCGESSPKGHHSIENSLTHQLSLPRSRR